MVKETAVCRYMATCVPGAEAILAGELAECVPASAGIRQDRGKIFLELEGGPAPLMKLRCADNIYQVLDTFSVGPHKEHLAALERHLEKTDCRPLAQGRGKRVIVSASRAGKHTYSRYDLAERAAAALKTQGFIPTEDTQDHDIAFRLDVKGEECLFSMQLTSATFRFRGENLSSSRGGIRPTVAHALVRVSLPRPGEVFCDPFCGAGTIPMERMSYAYGRIIAGDRDPQVLSIARMNLDGGAEILQADATRLPLEPDSVDALVTNMPWGKQIQVDDLAGLYRDFALEVRRILAPGGRAVLFTDQEEILRNACAGAGLSLKTSAQLSLHGLHPSIFVLRQG